MAEGNFFHELVFFVNGKKIVEEHPNPEWTLLYYLRNKLKLIGTKLGCAEGGCGACTVMISKYERIDNKIANFPVNACLAPLCSMHGLAVTTIEGIGSTTTKLHPVQERIAKAHGSQCGFCTPGIVMSMYSLLRNMSKPSMKDLEVTFQGNLCRCTGYRPIIEAYKTFTEEWEVPRIFTNGNDCSMGDKCCKLNSSDENEKLFEPSTFKPHDSSQEPIFPPELKLNPEYDQQNLQFKSAYVTWYRPTTLENLLKLKSSETNSKVVAGNTEIGVEIKFKNNLYPVLIQSNNIPEMNAMALEKTGLRVGASVTLNELNQELIKSTETLPQYKTRIFAAIIEMLHWFAGKQIRSVASVGGNIITGSPISDLNPIFMAANIEMVLQSRSTKRIINLDNNFFTGYRTNILTKNEVLISILIPFTSRNQYFYSHKQARRRDDDIAIVNSAMNFIFKKNTKILDTAVLSFGGMSATTVTAPITQERLKNLAWSDEILDVAFSSLLEDLPLRTDAPGGMIRFRKVLPISFFFRTFVNISKELKKIYPDINVDPRDLSAANKFGYKPPESSQFFQVVPMEQNAFDEVGRPVVHQSAYKQACGEAIYFDDIPKFEDELYMSFVYSKKAHANILSVDASEALKIDGVKDFISSKDIDPENKIGPIVQDEELFISKISTAEYQIIGALLAVDQITAQKAANKVMVKYEELTPIIVSIEDAIKHNSFYETTRRLEVGNVEDVFKTTKHFIENECRIGYQEHFYLETNGCLVIPKEGDFEIYSSTQNHAEITVFVSKLVGVPQNRIITKVKRIGGGFGGKQSRGVTCAVAAAIAAKKFKKPVRIMLDRDEDMASTGGRHPYLIRYKAAFEETGKITALDVNLFANGGFSNDLSVEVLERAMFHVENAYKIPNLRAFGRICKTNLPTNTAFRGFGAPQSMFGAETMLREVAEYLGKDSIEIALKNLYQEGDMTHYNQAVLNCNLQQCVEECLEMSQYYKRKEEIKRFNKENRWKKRGITVLLTKYGVGFGVPFLEQAGALIMVYTDGSLLLTHSGVEMGQGLNTKMIQICSRVLGIPAEKIYISECATDKVPNTSPTAASVGSDLNGVAVMRACEKIKERLKPVIEKYPKASWDEWVNKAYFERISLSATAYYYTPDIVYNWSTNTGQPYNYYTYGVACTEVEIDCLTGDHQVLRSDVVMDIGNSLNPAIDIGQIEGGFMQGYGLFVMEEMMYSPKGSIYTKGPGAYKIPGFTDIPVVFNVSLLKGVSNPRAVYSSKAVGEPPLFLASSALFAIREAVKSAREDAGVFEKFTLNAPATAEKIRVLCEDNITSKVPKDLRSTWNVIP